MGQSPYPYEAPTRDEYLVLKYGECCTRTTAAKILGKNAATISEMARDGRLETVCGGKKICMHSIALYMDAPGVYNNLAFAKKKYGRVPAYYIPPSARA